MDIGQAFSGLVDDIIAVLPASPFQQFIEEFESIPYLGYLNWFFPVRGCLIVLAAWLGAVALFYLYSVVMRWAKMIGD